jgi:hypothetical protein
VKCTHLLNQYKDRNEVVAELEIVKKTNYDIQKQFNEQSLAYAKEVEISQNWEKLHKELSTKYYELEKKYNLLKIDHDKPRKKCTQWT